MATKARLHWFWRGLIALLIGAVMCIVSFLVINALVALHGLPDKIGIVAMVLLAILPGIVIYGFLTWRLGPQVSDGENHCHRCGYILRGLSEPRCPECGEAI